MTFYDYASPIQNDLHVKYIRRHRLIKKDPNIVDIENKLMERIGMRVYVKNNKNNSGTLTIQYKGLDQMERLIQVIKSNY